MFEATMPHDPQTPSDLANALLAWLQERPIHRAGTLRRLCASDPAFARLWESLPHGVRRKTGRAFNRLVRERVRRPGDPLVWCYNLPEAGPNVHALYEVLPGRT
jgi:hypothetical protein